MKINFLYFENLLDRFLVFEEAFFHENHRCYFQFNASFSVLKKLSTTINIFNTEFIVTCQKQLSRIHDLARSFSHDLISI